MAKQQKEKGEQQKNKKHLAIFWRRRSRRKKIDKNRNATQERVGFCCQFSRKHYISRCSA